MIENIEHLCHGLELQRKRIEMGIHETNIDCEDYPGGKNDKGVF